MKPLVKFCTAFFGTLIMNPTGPMPEHLGGPKLRPPIGERRAAKRFVVRNTLRKLEANGDRLVPKRAGQCNYGNCPECGTNTLVVITPFTREMMDRGGMPPVARVLCDQHGEKLRELYTAGVTDERSIMFGGEVVFAPIVEAA